MLSLIDLKIQIESDFIYLGTKCPYLQLSLIDLKIQMKANKSISFTIHFCGYSQGRKPNIHVSAKIAEATQDQSTYIKLRGFKDEHYKKLILEYLDKYKQASKTDIDELILDILPDILDEEKKQNKVRNLIYAMSKKDKTIANKGTTRYPKCEKV